ncbi:NADP-dependent oxidoreductase [Rhizobium leguminosarum]|uniref:NADP-dependent oxidoreductase n=1 Tax=Rhizobium leguminosarum TaxID=384 RepID=UPI00103C95E5|nr:NADP-dependent oxidoreductase [Rhizobium leguminosarum]MBY5385297.1 NADP-dependent oxidoreductase [Rhizobium leguminosarum]MBY5788138.1 NADP-dependent oxidoreductase [Rhizobium leguminosarum]MCA2435551.1 NADP-dependent oxidoreductase [Rhizobium leguminosarum]NEH73666.1 zinc-binding dehydrogenase [Rhizobium leguminosarum]NEI93891.1 zinc-binding dehydrogenase [Rhizobium leguminosarum]
MANQHVTRIVLASRPSGMPAAANFRLERETVRDLAEGEILLQILYLSLDPYMRGRMDDAKSYAKPIEVDGVMEGGTVARVVRTRNAVFNPGDIVLSHSGWQSHAISNGSDLKKLDPGEAPITTALGILGMPGFTAYAGLRNIGKPKAGETLVVAAASGAVGSAVGQIARIFGSRVVGIAGGREKCAYLRDELGFDAAIDHRSSDFPAELAVACPEGIDIYFENVGGHVWSAVFPLLNDFARVPVCGLIAHYNEGASNGQDQLPAVMRAILRKSLTLRGFIQREFADQRPDFYREAGAWIAEGRLKYKEDIVDGLENAPDAFLGLLEGRNFGKLIIRVGS